MEILIASHNRWKIEWILDFLWKDGFVSLNDIWFDWDCDECGETYEPNAIIKAKYYWDMTWYPTISDDSWIEVEALKGELWIKTRRWGAGSKASDKEWLDYFLTRMVNESNRRAKFISVLCFYDLKNHHTFIGECNWTLLWRLDTDIIKWIPLSSIFVPDGFDKPFSLLTSDELNQVSHRWKACRALKHFLNGR